MTPPNYTHEEVEDFVMEYFTNAYSYGGIEKYRAALYKKLSPLECLLACLLAYLDISCIDPKEFEHPRKLALLKVIGVSFEDLPLHINDTASYIGISASQIVAWRLKIGR